MKVALHAINGVGLGHLARMHCLATALGAIEHDVQTLFLTNAQDVHWLDRDGFDYVAFPPRIAEPHAAPLRARTGLPDSVDEAAVIGALRAFAPDLTVFDTHAPAAVVRTAVDLGSRTVLVLRGLRRPAWLKVLASAQITDFDVILVPHDPEEAPPVPDEISHQVVGTIVRPLAIPPDAERPADRAPHVLVLAGAGGQPVDARSFLQSAADAHWLARAHMSELRTTLITGPYGPGVRAVPGLEVRTGLADTATAMKEADLVVSQAGYNVIAELRSLAKPSVLIPGRRRMESQAARARALARAGAALVTEPTPRAIADAIEAAFADGGARLAAMTRAHRRRPLVPGNQAAAAAALRLLRPSPGPVRRVVLVAHDFPPRIGGMETVACEIAAGLARQGLDVTVYTSRRLGADDVPGVRVRRLFTPLRDPHSIDLLRDLLLTVDAALRDRPDVIHLCHAGLSPWIAALRAAWPCRITINVHGNDLLKPWVHATVDDATYAAAQSAGLGAADRVLPVSEFSAGLARARGVAAERIHLVSNGVDVERYRPGTADAAFARVLTVSRLARRKGHATVVRAMAEVLPHIPEARYAWTGASDRMTEELLALGRTLGIANCLDPLGFLPATALPGLLQSARVFVLVPDVSDANDVEGFGVALLEAAAAGLPVVASRAGGVPEAVEDGVTGILVPPGDVAATATAIRRLLADRALAEAMGARGRERVLRRFTWQHTCAAFMAAWSDQTSPAASLEPLQDLLRAPAQTPYPPLIALRDLLGSVTNGSQLARLARWEAREARARAQQRREAWQRDLAHGRRLRLRATGDGERLLPEAVADARALRCRPDFELRLRRFLDPDVRAHVLPHADAVLLHHSVPAPDSAGIAAKLRALPDAEVRAVRSLRIHMSLAASADASPLAAVVPEVHRLREFFAARGATVTPPPELMRYLSLTPSGRPSTAMIEPTNHCNLHCPTCPTGTGKIPPRPDLTPERFQQALGGLLPGLRNLALWNYGEPTLNRHLPEFITHAKRAGVGVVKVSSNVHFLDGARAAALLESGLDVLILSVDGASQKTYATFRQNGDFARVEQVVRHLCAEKRQRGLERPRIELQFIAMRHNEHEIPDIRRLAADWGVDRLRIKTFGAEDDVNRDLVPDQPELSRYAADRATPNRVHPFCTMAWDHTVIQVDGAVTPCCYLRPDMGDRFVMGNVFQTSFLEIWRGERYRRFRAAMLHDRSGMPVCDRCRGGTHDLLAAVEEVTP